MSNYSGFLYEIYHFLASIPPKLTFKTKDRLSEAQREQITKMLAEDYYIILTGNRYHVSSWFVRIMTLFKTGKWTRYSHALMNCDYVDNPSKWNDFKFVEATAVGVHYSTFDEVFDCDAVCLLSPRYILKDEWTLVIDSLVKMNGVPYDDLFDLSDKSHLSCVELVRDALKADPDYLKSFPNFEEMIVKNGNQLVPNMFRECSDFKILLEF